MSKTKVTITIRMENEGGPACSDFKEFTAERTVPPENLSPLAKCLTDKAAAMIVHELHIL